jgi:phosphatidylglycerophosphate synthase
LLRGESVTRKDLPDDIKLLDARSLPVVFDYELRRTSQPFVLRVGRDTRWEIETETFALAYKGVTDIVTKYVYPRPAFHATRLAARLGIKPNTVTAGSLVLVIAVLYLFAEGQLALGLAAGFLMSFLDTVDGKLARVSQTSSPFGNYFDHAIDQVHPPFWWLAWWWGGVSVSEPSWWNVAAIICVVGYIALRVLEATFTIRFGVRIHVWKRFDSRFRLFTSRRNTNLILLTLATLLGRPELGLAAVAFWTSASLAIHGTRWLQAELELRRTGALESWLETSQAA